ncbi:hypothetical protein HA402_004447 [Bradysia odoriphaga]|nr:hypothetical protein HA402_004447 [Bradysia odoriphaga]
MAKNCVTCIVIDLFGNTKSSKVACNPYRLYDALKKNNKRLSDLLNSDHQDAHEFLIVLNQELERQPHYARWFSDNFSANLATHIKCNSCGKVHESRNEVQDFALDLVGNRSIQAAVDSYFNYDDVDFLCEDCRTYDTLKKKYFILSAPSYLCLQLRRFSEQGTKITDTIEISGLSLKNHFLKTQTLEWKYKLIAVVNHFGESQSVGHYNTIVLLPNGTVYEFDDRSVRQDTQRPSGRRIVDMDYVFMQMAQVTDFACRQCENGKLNYTKEIRKGMQSLFIFECKNCGNSAKFDSCRTYDVDEDINTSAVLGIISIGLGYYHLQEFMAHLNVPVMSYMTYHKHEEDRIQGEYLKLSKQLEDAALAEEIRLAIAANQVDSAGNALISVEFDGSWEKRSYTTNFSSLAGCAAIIGLRTKKILYSATKQKYCHICKISTKKGVTPRQHICKQNYDGPSSGMETQIIIEGFKYCAEKGARFNKFVGDGDSSTYKALRDLQIYRDPPIMIEKFECVNHLFRNFFKQFKALFRKGKVSSKGRKLITLEIGRMICKGVRLAARYWRESTVELTEKYHNLEKDILNAFPHYLGIHDDCASYFCQKETNPDAVNTLKALKETGVYYEVMDMCQSYFGNNVKSLVAGLCTNKTEGFNSLIAKSIGKKKRKCQKNVVAKENKPKNFHTDEAPSKNKKKRLYADGHEDLDMTDSNYETAKTRFLERLCENQINRLNIEIETRGQPHSFRWTEVRKLLLTSSYFGRLLNVRSRHSYTKIVEGIIYKNIQYANTADMRH